MPGASPLPHRKALHVAAAVSTYDRFVVVPLLVILGTTFDRPVSELLALAVCPCGSGKKYKKCCGLK